MIVSVVLFMIVIVSAFAAAMVILSHSTPSKGPEKHKEVMCSFEGEDLYNKHVISENDASIVDIDTQVPCTSCDQYVYKDDEGKCSSFQYSGKKGKICMASFDSVSCPVKTPHQK